MSKVYVNNDFDYVLLNAQILRRCTRVNIVQLVIFTVALVCVYYLGRYSNNCDFYYSGVYSQRLDVSENLTISEEDEGGIGQNESTTKTIPTADYVDVLR